MRDSNIIGGMILAIMLLSIGHYLQREEDSRNVIPVRLVESKPLTRVLAPAQPQLKMHQPMQDENSGYIGGKKGEDIAQLLLQEELVMDESGLPTGLSPGGAVLDPDDESLLYVDDGDVIPVNHGVALDPDLKNSLSFSSDIEEEVRNIGAFMEPDGDASLMASEIAATPQYIGPFIDPDNDETSVIIQDTPGGVVNIGEYLDPNELL